MTSVSPPAPEARVKVDDSPERVCSFPASYSIDRRLLHVHTIIWKLTSHGLKYPGVPMGTGFRYFILHQYRPVLCLVSVMEVKTVERHKA